MAIYGLALLSFCYLAGQWLGEFLGNWLGINSNVGGVGFAMLLLIFSFDFLQKRNFTNAEFEKGISFWSALYIPVIVGMSASQNVKQALSSGVLAILAGIIPVVACYLLIPLITSYLKNEVNE